MYMNKINDNWCDNIDWIIAKYKEGWNQVKLATEFPKATNTTIRRILIKNNIEIRPNGYDNRFVKHNPFEDMSDPEVQYWMGMITTDGCVYKNVIALSSARKDHIDQYLSFMNNSINACKTLTRGEFICYQAAFSNPDVVKYMISMGITSKKSYDLKINFPITWDFLRGVIDGDGCIAQHKNKAGIITRLQVKISTKSPYFKDQLYGFLDSHGLEPTVYSRKSDGLLSVDINKQGKVKQLYYNMYKHAPRYFIKDKYDRFGAIFGKPNDKEHR